MWTEWAQEKIELPECKALNVTLQEALGMALPYRLVDSVVAHHGQMGDAGHWVIGHSGRPNIAGRSYALMTVIGHPYFFIEVDEEHACTLRKIQARSWQKAEEKMDRLVSRRRAAEPEVRAFAFESPDEVMRFLQKLS